MESINLGAVLFALLLLIWVAYALPRIAARRDVMGRARSAEVAESSAAARDLSAAVHARRSSREVSPPMTQDRLLLRPADPTSRPRFEADPGERVDPLEERARSRRTLGVVLGGLVVGTLALAALAVMGTVHWALPVLAGAGLAAYLVGLRRAELERRTRVRRAAALARIEARDRAEAASREERSEAAEAPVVRAANADRAALEDTAVRATAQVRTPGEWVPRPVPQPTYTMRGEVDDLATRHAAHRASLRSGATPLERDGIEEVEAADESLAAPATDLHLDEILERRRA